MRTFLQNNQHSELEVDKHIMFLEQMALAIIGGGTMETNNDSERLPFLLEIHEQVSVYNTREVVVVIVILLIKRICHSMNQQPQKPPSALCAIVIIVCLDVV